MRSANITNNLDSSVTHFNELFLCFMIYFRIFCRVPRNPVFYKFMFVWKKVRDFCGIKNKLCRDGSSSITRGCSFVIIMAGRWRHFQCSTVGWWLFFITISPLTERKPVLLNQEKLVTSSIDVSLNALKPYVLVTSSVNKISVMS